MEMKFVDDLSLDSLDLVEFVMVLEDHFEIEVGPLFRCADIQTIPDLQSNKYKIFILPFRG